MKPKISIITVCFNSEAHIEEALLSVINQPYDNKEYLVIDGGSTDRTLSIIEKYKDKIDYFVSEPDKGISDAFNKGIRAATGDVIGICNSDDKLAEDVLTQFAPYFDGRTDVYRLDEALKDYNTGEIIISKPTLILPNIPIMSTINHMGCYITKNAYEKYGMYDVNFKYCMDLELLRRFSYNGAIFKYVPVNVGFFRQGGVSQSNEKLMRNERRLSIVNYGGNKFEAECFVFLTIIKQVVKKILNAFSDNAAAKIRGKKY